MSEQGNVRLKGAISVEADGTIVAGSNNGMFSAVSKVGVGHYKYEIDPEWSIAFGDCIKVTVDGAEGAPAMCSSVQRLTQVRFDVYISEADAEPVALDAGHSVRVTNINRG